jgi:hypothetical protein
MLVPVTSNSSAQLRYVPGMQKEKHHNNAFRFRFQYMYIRGAPR